MKILLYWTTIIWSNLNLLGNLCDKKKHLFHSKRQMSKEDRHHKIFLTKHFNRLTMH